MRKKIAAGRVFQRAYLDRKGVRRKTNTWFLKYYVQGKPVEEPTGTENFEEAVCILRQKMARVARKTEYPQEPERVIVDQLLELNRTSRESDTQATAEFSNACVTWAA